MRSEDSTSPQVHSRFISLRDGEEERQEKGGRRQEEGGRRKEEEEQRIRSGVGADVCAASE